MSNAADVSLDLLRPEDRVQVVNRSRGTTLVEAPVLLCLRPWSRLRGLLGRPQLGPSAGLLLRPCRSVHSFFMGYPIDVAFLDARGGVVAVAAGLRPWRVTPYCAEADATLEMAAGRLEATRTAPGDLLAFVRLPQGPLAQGSR